MTEFQQALQQAGDKALPAARDIVHKGETNFRGSRRIIKPKEEKPKPICTLGDLIEWMKEGGEK